MLGWFPICSPSFQWRRTGFGRFNFAQKYGIGELDYMGVSINGDTQKWIWVNYNISLTWIVLNCSAIKGDDFPYFSHDFRVRSQVVMKFTQKWMVYKGTSIKGSMEWKHLHIWQAAVQCCGLRWQKKQVPLCCSSCINKFIWLADLSYSWDLGKLLDSESSSLSPHCIGNMYARSSLASSNTRLVVILHQYINPKWRKVIIVHQLTKISTWLNSISN